jgi:hypothetical protein
VDVVPTVVDVSGTKVVGDAGSRLVGVDPVDVGHGPGSVVTDVPAPTDGFTSLTDDVDEVDVVGFDTGDA